jgi:putative glutathione S-transferase
MGLLVNGQWKDQWYDTETTGGKFVRDTASFRNWVTRDGSAGCSGEGGFIAEKDRYHLYVSLACPWAHRTLIVRSLKGLNDFIDVSVVHPFMGNKGWSFENDFEGATGDPLFHYHHLYQLYAACKPDFTGRVTVPVLFDKKTNQIVSNESAEIIRMLNTAFNDLIDPQYAEIDLYPAPLQGKIDDLNDWIYDDINNGVYKSGFATEQEAYEQAVAPLFEALDRVESILSQHRYLAGSQFTEADVRLFTTLIRFDEVYHGHFKCNRKRMIDYPNLFNYIKEIYQMGSVADTVSFDHIKTHYYTSHTMINPTQVVPVGPAVNFNEPHNRGDL